MMQSKLLYKSPTLSNFPDLIHGFTTRQAGNFRLNNSLTLERLFRVNPFRIITMSQVHGPNVLEIKPDPKGQNDQEVDGLVSKDKNIFLAVKTADCLPILFFDPINRVLGACHAGWKGTLAKIQQNTVKKMLSLGAELKNTIAVFGPHIEQCCYNISEERVKLFEFSIPNTQSITRFNGKSFLSLSRANHELLTDIGIAQKNIEAKPFCTSCQNNRFYSFRKEGSNYGEQLSLIGLIK